MKLDEIKISGYKCFEQYSLKFAPRTTVLFGVNGVGKTTVLNATKKALSFVFSKAHKAEHGSLSAGNQMLRVENYSRSAGDARRVLNGQVVDQICISASGKIGNCRLPEWSICASTSTFGTRKSGYSKAYTSFIESVRDSGLWPVLAYYSDSYPHIVSAPHISNNVAGLRNFGYYQWNTESSSDVWISQCEKKVLFRDTLRLQQEKGILVEKSAQILSILEPEISSIEKALVEFSKGDPTMEVSSLAVDYTNKFRLQVETNSGASHDFRNLPAGYRRLYSIVLDLAYRATILNPGKDVTEASGVVIIDEIDLHLHPRLEREVVARFERTFPNIQFIISTHSPLVLINLDTTSGENRILRMRLAEPGPEEINDAYGLDYNAGIEGLMGVEAADWELKSLIDSAKYFKANDAAEQYQNIYEYLLAKVNGNEERLQRLLEE